MPLCDLCASLLGCPGYVPPHSRLSKSGEADAAGRRIFIYTCQGCRHVFALATRDDDEADYWMTHAR